MTVFGEQLDMLSGLCEGERRKEQALSEHEEHKAAAIRWLRKQMAQLYQLRSRGFTNESSPWVTADDARRIYDGSRFPPEYSQNRTFFGSIFRGKDWQIVGRIQSTHPSNNARSICCYRYVG